MNLYAKALLTRRRSQLLWRIYGATEPSIDSAATPDNPVVIQSASNFTIANTNSGQSVNIAYTLCGLKDGSGAWGARDYIEIDHTHSTVTLSRLVGTYGLGTDGKSFKLETAYSSSWRYSMTTTDKNMFRDNAAHWLVCTDYPGISAAAIRANGSDAVAIYKEGDTYSQLDLRSTQISTAEQLNTWIATEASLGTPVTVVYALDAVQTDDITDTATGQALLAFPPIYPGESLTEDSGLGVELVTR